MKTIPGKRFLSVLAVGLTMIFASLPLSAQSAGQGSISGTVTNVEVGRALSGAQVQIRGTNISVITDSAGAYYIPNVPAGGYMLTASYPELTDDVQSVTVVAGVDTTVDFLLTSSVYVMEPFSVKGEREGESSMLVLQRNADSPVRVIDMESMGVLANDNTGELLAQLPGFSADLDDEGNVQGLNVRGIAKQLNLTLVDGARFASAAGLNRDFRTHNISGAYFGQIATYRTVTPDMDHDGLGGIIDYITYRPLNEKNRKIDYNVSLSMVPSFWHRTPQYAEHWIHPKISLGYIDTFRIFGAKRPNLGVFLRAFYSENARFTDFQRYYYTRKEDPSEARIQKWDTQNIYNNRKQKSASLKLEWQISKVTKFSIGGIYNDAIEPFSTNRTTEAQITNTAGSTAGSSGDLLYGATNGSEAAHYFRINSWTYDFADRQRQWSAYFEHKFRRLKIDWGINQSRSKVSMHCPTFENDGVNLGLLTMTANRVAYTVDRSGDPYTPKHSFTGAKNPYDLSSYDTLTIIKRHRTRYQEVTDAKFDVDWKPSYSMPLDLKFGGKIRRFDAGTTSANVTYQYRHAISGLEHLLDPSISTTYWGEGALPWFDNGLVNQDLARSLTAADGRWTQSARENPLQFKQDAREDIYSLYGMGTYRFKNLSILAGVRFERTEVSGEGYVDNKGPELEYRKNTAHYGDFYPSVHLTYRVTKDFRLRLSWSNTIGRAPMSAYVPTFTTATDAETGELLLKLSNPGIKPQRAKNWDLLFEYDIGPTSFINGGVFRKDIDKFIFTARGDLVSQHPELGLDPSYDTYVLSMDRNGGDAKVEGLEFEFKQNMDFLPGIWKKLTFRFNYTRLWTNGDYGGLSTTTKTTELANFVPESVNIHIGWSYKRFKTLLKWNHSGNYLKNYYDGEARNLYIRSRSTLGLDLSYRIQPELELYINIANIFNSQEERYQYDKSRLHRVAYTGRFLTVGAKGRF